MPKRTTPNDRIVELVRRGVRPTRPTALGEKIPDDLWAIMVYCWNHDPSQRPTALNLRHELKRRLNSR